MYTDIGNSVVASGNMARGGGAKFDKLIDLPDLCINHKLCTKNVSEGTGETNHRTVAA